MVCVHGPLQIVGLAAAMSLWQVLEHLCTCRLHSESWELITASALTASGSHFVPRVESQAFRLFHIQPCRRHCRKDAETHLPLVVYIAYWFLRCFLFFSSTHSDRQGVDISVTVCMFVCVCTVADFSAEDKTSGVTFCTAIHLRPRQGITQFCELCSPKSPKSDESASSRATPTRM